MGLGTGIRNPFAQMTDEQLAQEIDTLVKFVPLNLNARMLLGVIELRLSGITKVDSQNPATPGTVFKGVSMAALKDGGDVWLAISNLIKCLMTDDLLIPSNDFNDKRASISAEIASAIDSRITQERLKGAQVYVQVATDLSKWRVFVDVMNQQLFGAAIRHYISKTAYYAYPVEFANPDTMNQHNRPGSNIIPPSWDEREVFTGISIDFAGSGVVTHYFVMPLSTGDKVGSYVCELTGVVKHRYEPGALDSSLK